MKTNRSTRAERGFALVVTLSLMILLTVVAVGLLTLSTITLRNTRVGESAAIARSNARMALMLAIGDLQREMGPDSRISAPDDAGSSDKGGQPHWTAVYDAWKREPGTNQETPGGRGNPTFRGWLVSGANAAIGGPAGTTDKVLLVGPGSLGAAGTAPDEIRVPMHKVVNAKQGGRVAWWMSDESTKAKVNAGPDTNTASSFGNSDPLLHAQAPPNIGHRAIALLANMDWKEGVRSKAISTSQLSLAAGLGNGGLGRSIHDVTVHSAGVLANVREGRLKRDLSNLLTRDVTELQDKPLYLANGRINWFDIKADGSLANTSGLVSTWAKDYNSASHWGINLEELFLFHNLNKEISWTGGKPSLRMKSQRTDVVADRFFMYRRPSIQALQFIFSLEAVKDTTAGAAADSYMMQMSMDAMVSLSNPNDVPLVYPPGLDLPFQLYQFPYNLTWDIKRAAGPAITTTAPRLGNLNIFKGHIEGGVGGAPIAGFTLEPGEAAVFGSSSSTGYELNLKRGFVPSGGVKLNNWKLGATGLKSTDSVSFELTRFNGTQYYNTWIGPRAPTGWQMDSAAYSNLPDGNTFVDQYLPPKIKPSQTVFVSEFINKPKPVVMVSFLQNVEQASKNNPPDAFASRPSLLNEPSLNGRNIDSTRFEADIHANQMPFTAEAMNYNFTGKSIAAGAGGRNLLFGGGRDVNLGGSFSVISRRTPIAPPLSLGAFQNAIASGFCDHFNEAAMLTEAGAGALNVGNDPFPSQAVGLTGHVFGLPIVARAIGNSRNVPQLKSNEVYSSSSTTSAAVGTRANVATDQSWMVNTALWDSWFLSGIVDGTGGDPTSWMKDSRTPKAQFKEFAAGTRSLHNKRYLFHPFKSAAEAEKELFDGEKFKKSAINQLSNYLLVDGAFNVNSTSVDAWRALFSSGLGQSVITATGGLDTFNHPFGTLGYATSTATSGTEGDWKGLRDLSDSEITKLAAAIVTEVKGRGPFLSLADFVNRRPNSQNPGQQAVGALQSAIDLSGLNDRFSNASRTVAAADFAALGGNGISAEPLPARAVGAPGCLSQGDLLTAIGSQISVRSDTFVIRCYGDARDSADRIQATAWCEAVIQRVPEYIDPADKPEAQTGWPTATTTLTPANTKFGRRFMIKSFRWLDRREI